MPSFYLYSFCTYGLGSRSFVSLPNMKSAFVGMSFARYDWESGAESWLYISGHDASLPQSKFCLPYEITREDKHARAHVHSD